MMNVCSWFCLALRGYFEFLTTLLMKHCLIAKYFQYGRCKSDRRMDGKVVVITGASAGLGKATALLLAQRGAKIVMAVRNLDKAARVVKEIKTKVPAAQVDLVELELSSLDSVRECAQVIRKRYKTVDVLVNNAGIWSQSGQRTVDGHEIHFGVNYLSHFLLTLLLLPNLKKSTNGKVVNVSSAGHRFSSLDLTDLYMTKSYYSIDLYGKSKLAQVLFTRELAALCSSVKAYAVHPGAVNSEFGGNISKSKLIECFLNLLMKTPEEGAQTILHCILDPQADLESGLYYANCRTETPSKEAQDVDTAKGLWSRSLQLVGLPEKDLDL